MKNILKNIFNFNYTTDAPQKDYFVYLFQKVFPDSKNKKKWRVKYKSVLKALDLFKN